MTVPTGESFRAPVSAPDPTSSEASATAPFISITSTTPESDYSSFVRAITDYCMARVHESADGSAAGTFIALVKLERPASGA